MDREDAVSKKKTALWIVLVAGSLLLPRQLPANKLEGIILQNEGTVLQVLDVVSYEKYQIPITESTQAVRKNHEDITAGDLKAGYDPMQAPRVWHIFTQHTRDMNKVANFFYGSHSTHIARKRNHFREISQSYFDQVNQGLPVEGDAHRENALRHATNQDRAALYGFASTAQAPAALPKYSGFLFVPWRTKSHRRSSKEDAFLQASGAILMHLQSKGVDLVDDDLYQRTFHGDSRFRQLVLATQEVKELPLFSVISTARSLGADSVLVLRVSRPVTKFIKLEAQCYDLTARQLWEVEGVGRGYSSKKQAVGSLSQLTAALDEKLGGSCLPLKDEKP